MSKHKYLVVYASETGNTERVAKEIYLAIHSEEKELLQIRNWNGQSDGDIYFIGFWVNHSSCSIEIMDLLMSLHGKTVALFCTCGMGDSLAYHKLLENQILAFLPSDNRYMGAFFCRGKMSPEIRQNYNSFRGDKAATWEKLMQEYEASSTHPDNRDLLRANIFVDEVFRKIGIRK